MTRRLGLLGGAFNPVHMGHLLQAHEALWQLQLDEVVFMPTYLPPHKSAEGLLSYEDRLRLLQEATSEVRGFSVSTLERDRGGTSYTVETLRALQDCGEWTFLIGIDAFLEIQSWHKYREVFQLCRFAVTTRAGMPVEGKQAEALRAILDDLGIALSDQGEGHRFLAFPGMEVSSTLVRRRILAGEPLRYLVPPGVEKYVFDHPECCQRLTASPHT